MNKIIILIYLILFQSLYSEESNPSNLAINYLNGFRKLTGRISKEIKEPTNKFTVVFYEKESKGCRIEDRNIQSEKEIGLYIEKEKHGKYIPFVITSSGESASKRNIGNQNFFICERSYFDKGLIDTLIIFRKETPEYISYTALYNLPGPSGPMFFSGKVKEKSSTEFEIIKLTFTNKEIKEIKLDKRAKSLNLTSRSLSEIHGISNLLDMERVDLTDNRISSLEYLKNKKLENLYLGGNLISEIDLTSLPSLKKLSLAENRLTKIPDLREQKLLSELYLKKNNIIRIDNLNHFIPINTLDLGYNKIKKLEGLDSLTSLQTLYLNNNNIQVVDNLTHLRSLRTLILNSNKINRFGHGLLGADNLVALELNGNELKDLKGVEQLKNLESLFAIGNKLVDIRNLNGLHKLGNIVLIKNEIEDISFLSELPALRNLVLSSNRITSIESLGNLKNLELIDLSNNQVKEIKPLLKLQKLETLIIAGNPIPKNAINEYKQLRPDVHLKFEKISN